MPTLISPTDDKSRNEEQGMARGIGDARNDECQKEVMPVEEIEEGTQAKAMRQPYQPTQKEIEDHELTHIPFRDWCVHLHER